MHAIDLPALRAFGLGSILHNDTAVLQLSQSAGRFLDPIGVKGARAAVTGHGFGSMWQHDFQLWVGVFWLDMT